MKSFILLVSILKILSVSSSCDNQNVSGSPAIVIEEDEQIFIKDQTGKVWEITHAVKQYGFSPGVFRNGLGPYAIAPIGNPEFLDPGNKGFPTASESFLVIGTTINDMTRAYSLRDLYTHEIVNDEFDSTYVAVGY